MMEQGEDQGRLRLVGQNREERRDRWFSHFRRA
jgi:hypothetical protein